MAQVDVDLGLAPEVVLSGVEFPPRCHWPYRVLQHRSAHFGVPEFLTRLQLPETNHGIGHVLAVLSVCAHRAVADETANGLYLSVS